MHLMLKEMAKSM